MKTVTLKIPGMKSQHCQMTVRNAVVASGASVKSISAGLLELGINEGMSENDIVNAIEKAGYQVQEIF